MIAEARSVGRTSVDARRRVLDYVELMKPELTFLSVLSALCGFYLGSVGPMNALSFIHTAIGTILLGGGAGALNQYIERVYDGLMKRTERRPLPSGRMQPGEALIFAIILASAGILELTILVNVLSGALGALTFITYIFVYTPMKRLTPMSTLVGAIPGALPPMIGWAAARNSIDGAAWILFAILFFWQIPHFLSLAWMYKKDYARAGFRMLTVTDDNGRKTSRQILSYTLLLLPATLLSSFTGVTGLASTIAAITLGGAFILLAFFLYRATLQTTDPALQRVNFYARQVFFASLLYLPMLMIVMSMDKV